MFSEFFIFAISGTQALSQDVAICGLDGSGGTSTAGDEFSFVLLRDFTAGEIIYFTEDEYSDFANSFNSGEGHLSYTVPAGGLLENDVVRIRETGANVFAVECASGTAALVAGSGTWSFSSSDELYAYSASNASIPWSSVTEIHCFYYGAVIVPTTDQQPQTDYPAVILIAPNFLASSPTNNDFMDASRVNTTLPNLQNASNWSGSTSDITLSCTDFTNQMIASSGPTFTALADLCIDAGLQSALGGGDPTGGIYSGTGITDDGNGMTYSFDPEAAGVGTHTITYTESGNNTTDDVEVFSLPIVAFTAPMDVCVNAGVQVGLNGGTPTGGVYSGTGVTDDGNGMTYSFDPAAAGEGTHIITYNYTDANGCSASASDDVEVFSLPIIAFTAPMDVCVDAGVQAGLNGGTPTGGVYSGTGVTDDGNGMTYSFDPAASGVGVHTITYNYTDANGCTTSASDNVEVFDLPTVSFIALANLCIDAGLQTGMGSGVPNGGVYSGAGVTDDGNGMTFSFDPASAGVGVHTITYTYNDTNNCTGSFSDDVEVFSLPIVAFTAPMDVCVNAGVQVGLNGGTPTGGVYSGTGVTDDGNGTTYSFDPASAGVGVHTITYNYTDVNGCTTSTSDDIEVIDLPVVSYTAPADLCIDAGVQTGLGGSTPSGGVYGGPGVTDDGNGMTYSFDPAAAGLGVHTITYTYNDTNNCTGSFSDEVEILPLPIVTLSTAASYCLDAPIGNISLTGGSPSGGVYSGIGVTDNGNGIDYLLDLTATGVGMVEITYTYTDENGCSNSASSNIEIADCGVTNSFDINDPCACLDNATIFDCNNNTGGDDGQFSEVVSITGAAGSPLPNGMTWSIVGATGAFDAFNIPAIGMQSAGVEIPGDGSVVLAFNSGVYEVPFVHVDDIGYSLMIEGPFGVGSPANVILTISNKCQYPDPVFDPTIPAIINTMNPVITLGAMDTNGGSEDGVTYTLDGSLATMIDPSALALGTHTIAMVYDGASDGNGGISPDGGTTSASPGCIQEVTKDFEIVDCALIVDCSNIIDLQIACRSDLPPVDFDLPIVVDSCGSVTLSALTIIPGNSGCPSDTIFVTRTYFIQDAEGNMEQCMQNIVIVDDVPPVPICMDITVELDENGLASIVASDIDGGSFANCGSGVNLSVDIMDFTCAQLGPNTVTLTAEDDCGNIDSCLAFITIEDDIPPALSDDPPASYAIEVDVNCSASFQLTDPTPEDNCGFFFQRVIITYPDGTQETRDIQPDVVFDYSYTGTGPIEFEWALQDNSGNDHSEFTTVTLQDNISPTITCPADITMNNDPDRCTAVVCYDVIVEDNCDAVLPEILPDFDFLGTFDGHNYFVSSPTNALGWEEANYAASAVGGHLVVITSDLEQQFIIDNVDNGFYRIGLRYSPSLGEFKWVNGETFGSFEAWGPGQPGILEGDYVYNLDVGGSFFDGWYDSPSILPLRYIVEIETYQTELLTGLPAGSNFPVGITEVTYRGLDASGNADTCSFNVQVFDNQSPIIENCPNDSTIQLVAEQCDTLVTFEDPLFTDNCPGAVITQIEGLPSGSLFPIGENIVSFEARDTSGNADTCTWTISVDEYIPQGLACNGDINFSIDEASCSGELTPSMLINVSSVGCADSCTITIAGADGIKREPVFTSDDVGKTFEYEICCGGICCWGTVNVEYKFDPVILCAENDTLSCTQAFSESIVEPDVSMSCGTVFLDLVEETPSLLNCDSLFSAQLVRKWVARDEYGNVSDTCTSTIYLERTNLNGIIPPQPAAIFNGGELSCSSGFATTSQGYPFPALSVTGGPSLNTDNGYVDIFPYTSGMICNGYAEFEDEIMPGSTSCVTKILRTFTIGEWWCGGTEQQVYKQLIEVVDFNGPDITCPTNMTVSTGSFACLAEVSVPLPTGTDKCNNDLTYNLGTPVGDFENYNGETFSLPSGVHTLNYAVYDGCGQGSFCSFTVTVVDNADPIAICDQFTEVSLSLETTTYVPAEAIDDGSFDECGPVTLSVARMDDPGFDDFTGFGPVVDINCTDAGQTVMVGLLVTDAGGNTNMCMVSVFVKDKVEAQMVCPGDTTVECNFAYDPENLSAFFGDVEIYDNCPASNTLDDKILGELNSCGSGELIRQITLYNAQGEQTDYCEQTITFESGSPLAYSDITPPNSPVEVTGCGIGALEEAGVSGPIIPDGVCQNIAISITSDTFPFTEEGACLKIIRTYSVIDWCISSGEGSIEAPWRFDQILKVTNTDKPFFTEVFAADTTMSFALDCGGTTVTGLTATASDNCTEDSELQRRYETRDSEGAIVSTGLSHDASGYYDLGDYTVTFIVEDLCGNQEVAVSSFSVMSGKQPVPYCLDGLSTTLTAMDTDGDGTADAEQVMLTASFFDAGSYHPCELDVAVSFSEDINDTIRVYSCADTVGVLDVPMWVTALDSNGEPLFDMADFCVASLDVQDNDTINLCDGVPKPIDIEGRIYTSLDAELNEAMVQLISAEMQEDMTDENGEYGFMDMPEGGNYRVSPYKDNDVLNGVSTLDLVMIQRHLLGLAEFEEAYKYIAADINHDDRLTASDLLTLRKTILGINTHFTNNTSWRFIDEAHEFEDERDPWLAPFAESYDISGLSEDIWIDFVAVKVGDINGNVDANLEAGIISETRSAQSLIMILPNTEVEADKVYEIKVLTSDAINLRGLQVSFSLNGLEIVEIKQGSMNIKSKDFVTMDDELKLSYANAIGDYAQADDVLYTLVLRAKSDGLLSEKIEIDDKSLNAEAYIGSNLKVGSVEIEWREDEEVAPVELLVGGSVSPNPWRSQSEIHFEIPREGEVKLTVRDAGGRLLYTRTEEFGAGQQTFTITNEDVKAKGLLLYELQYGEQVVHKKMIRIE